MIESRLAWFATFALVTALPAWGVDGDAHAPAGAGQSPRADDLYAQIDSLIEQLGSGKYIERAGAERQLLAIGYEAFDQLKAAESHEDPEVAARARHLTRQLTVDWTREGDSPAVQQLLLNYGRLSDEERIQRIAQLAALGPESVGPLCHIARFDISDVVAKRAALAVIDPVAGVDDFSDPAVAKSRANAVVGELGPSRRASAAWLRTYAEELVDPAASADAWQQHVDRALVDLAASDTLLHRLVAIDLMQHASGVYERLGRDEDLLTLFVRMIELDDTGAAGVLRRVVERLLRTKNWTAIDEIVERYEDRFRHEPIVMYMLAEARRQQGSAPEAAELAERAFKLSDDSFARSTIADELKNRGLYDWAEREFRAVLAKEPALSDEAIYAAQSLTAMFFDLEQFAKAAELADDFLGRVEQEDQKVPQGRFNLRGEQFVDWLVKHMKARADYFRASHAHQQRDPVTERKFLELAIAHDPRDIDVLIAMFRLPDDDVAFRADVYRRIEEEAKAIDEEIRHQPGNPTNYNNWAWLIANTRGDQEKAIRYSHRAVEMAGSDSLAGFLDTLARAYFAKGDVENAVRYQRRAVELEPHTQQLRRQLDQFEKAM